MPPEAHRRNLCSRSRLPDVQACSRRNKPFSTDEGSRAAAQGAGAAGWLVLALICKREEAARGARQKKGRGEVHVRGASQRIWGPPNGGDCSRGEKRRLGWRVQWWLAGGAKWSPGKNVSGTCACEGGASLQELNQREAHSALPPSPTTIVPQRPPHAITRSYKSGKHLQLRLNLASSLARLNSQPPFAPLFRSLARSPLHSHRGAGCLSVAA